MLTGGGNGIAAAALPRRASGVEIDWSKVHLFWGDDRYVADDDDERNDKQAREALLDHVDIPAAQRARDAGRRRRIRQRPRRRGAGLRADAGRESPTPAIPHRISTSICSGVGPEGHINSLFPDTPAVRETTRMVVDVEDSPKPPPQRITLTLPAIQRSREVWLVVSGAEKAEAVAAAIGGAAPVSIPAAGAIGRENTVWFLDSEAASQLPA